MITWLRALVSDTPPRRWLTAIADAISVMLLTTALASEMVGGFRLDIFGLRISLRSSLPILAWAGAVICVRHVLVAKPSLLNRLWRGGDGPAERRRIEQASESAARKRLSARILVPAFFAFVAMAMLHPQVTQPFSVPDHFDPLFSIWRLAWIAHQLPSDPLHLFDANIFYPHPRTLAYSDAILVPGLVAAPLLWLGVHPVVVYNTIFVAAIALSGATAFFLVRALVGSWEAAVISGLLFAFCAFRFAHYSHLELQVTLWMPLGLLWLHLTLVTNKLRYGLLTGLAVALQALSSLYYGMFFVALLAVLIGTLWLLRQLDGRRLMVPLLSGALLSLAVVVPVTVPYWQNRSTVGERGPAEIRFFSAQPGDYLVPHARSRYRGPETASATGERDLFPGIAPVVLAAVGLWPPLSPLRLAYGAGLALAYDASLGFSGHIYPVLYSTLTPFRGLRAPARFGVIVALTLSVLAGFGVARVISRITNARLRSVVVIAFAGVALWEARPALSLEPVWREPPAVYLSLPADRVSVVADLPLPLPAPYESVGEDMRFMYFSIFHWHRLINGASGFYPSDYYELRRVMHEFPSEESMRLLRRYGVEHVVIHAKFYSLADYSRIVASVEHHSAMQLIATAEWHGSEVRLYRLQATTAEPTNRPLEYASLKEEGDICLPILQ